MNKKGFTLMELLLVVAILAIVAAAAAPTFSQGASDALREARKSSFLAAYQNTVTGAHMMVALGASKGYDAKSIYLDNAKACGEIGILSTNIDRIDGLVIGCLFVSKRTYVFHVAIKR